MTKHLKLTLQESFEHTGLWWLPDEPENEIGGTLSYDPSEGIHLDLLGTFNTKLPYKNTDRFETEVVNGVTSSGIVCTLFDNKQIGYSIGSPGFSKQKLSSSLLIMGHDFSSFDQLNYEKWRVNFEHLEEWISWKHFDTTHDLGDEGIRSVTVTGQPETYFDEKINAIGGHIILTTDLISGGGASAGHFNLSKEAFFELIPDAEKPHENFRRWLADIQNLLSLLMVENVRPRKIHGYSSNNGEDDPPRFGVSVFYRLRSRSPLRSTRIYDMLIPFEEIRAHLATALERWLETEHGVQQAINLFFSDSNPREVDLDTQFANITNSLESYHRAIGKGSYLTADEYKPFLEEMVNAIPEKIKSDHRDALKARLKYGYEYSQRKRFQELFDSMSDELQSLVTSDAQAFINDVVTTRNYLVHRDELLATETLMWPERLYAYSRLRMLTTILFLSYIGLDHHTIYQHVSKNRRLKQFIGHFEEEE